MPHPATQVGRSGFTATAEIAPPGPRCAAHHVRPEPRTATRMPARSSGPGFPTPRTTDAGRIDPVLVIGRQDADRVYAVRLTSKAHDGDRDFLAIGSGAWDAQGRPVLDRHRAGLHACTPRGCGARPRRSISSGSSASRTRCTSATAGRSETDAGSARCPSEVAELGTADACRCVIEGARCHRRQWRRGGRLVDLDRARDLTREAMDRSFRREVEDDRAGDARRDGEHRRDRPDAEHEGRRDHGRAVHQSGDDSSGRRAP